MKRVHLDPHPCRSLFACVGAHLCFCPCFSHVVLLRAAWAVSNSLERKWVWACFGHSQLLTSKIIQPATKISVRHYDILPTSTTFSACFVTSYSPGTFFGKIWVSFRYRVLLSFGAGSIFASHMRARLPPKQTQCPHHKTRKHAQTKTYLFLWVPYRFRRFHATHPMHTQRDRFSTISHLNDDILWYITLLGGRRFLPQAPRSYPIPMAHRVTPGKPEVTPGTKSYWHTGTTPSLVWQTKHVKCVRAIANFIFNTISFGDKTMLKVGNRHWHTRIDSKTAAFHPNVKSNQFCSTRPVFLSWLWTWIRLFSVL